MKNQIELALKQLNLLDELKHVDLFIQYIKQLITWNKAYNLTALKTEQDILVQHLFDCLSIIPVIRSKWPIGNKHIIDIGSGAGLPGIVIAICQPQWQVTCIDAVGKKTAFIKQCKGILNLSNLDAVHGRIEKITNLKADLIISRAFASLTDFVNLAEMHINKEGQFLAMKGQYPKDEINHLESDTKWQLKENINLDVPFMQAKRCLLVLDRQ